LIGFKLLMHEGVSEEAHQTPELKKATSFSVTSVSEEETGQKPTCLFASTEP